MPICERHLQPSQLQWVKLACNAEPDAGFYAGRSVQIYAAKPIAPALLKCVLLYRFS